MSAAATALPARAERIAFAWRQLDHQRRRAAAATAGVSFALLVIFLQLGFYGAVVNTAVAITSRLDADLVLVSPRFVHLSETSTIERARLFQALAVPEVRSATPLYLRYAAWRDPVSGQHCKLFAMGAPLASGSPLAVAGVAEQLPALEPSGSLLLDRLSQRDCGPLDPRGNVEVREQTARVVGGFELGVGFLADGALLASDDTFSKLFDGHPLDHAHLGLLRLVPGADQGRAVLELRAALPPDTAVRTRVELDALQRRHWVDETAVGNIFAMGTIAGFFVGFVVLAQVLSTDIRNQLPLYATLKAMGYARRRLRRLVLEQAWLYALAGFAPAFAIAALVFVGIRAWTRLPVFMTPSLALGVLALAFAMCTAAAWLSARKLDLADPAELY